ncbi:MAG: capsule assembly Wzi family protein [Bacteroidota bacterium]
MIDLKRKPAAKLVAYAKRISILAVFVFITVCSLSAQSSSFLADGVQDFTRRQQLTGKMGLQSGLNLRSFESNYASLDTLLPEWKTKTKNIISGKNNSFAVQWLPVSSTIQFNSHHAYGLNDGAMVPARGMETLLSAGVLFTAGNFSVQLKPELVYAQNTDFETFPTEHYDVYWAQYYRLLNTIDLPEKFGNGSYKKIFAGQSSIRYKLGALSAGLSTENIWWGPGRYNALIMSNNAPGFAHITLNTIKPIETGIGSFEGQLIAGNLTSSGITPPDTNRYYNGVRLYKPKNEESRYLAGFMLSWQPKWVKGLSVGFTRVSYLYKSDVSGIADILPLEGVIKSNTEKNGQKAATGSLFARYVMPEEKAELYFEFGRNDKSPSLLNVIADNGYPRAYTAGFRKLFAIHKKDQFIEFASEFTQLQLPTGELTQQGLSWYEHPYVRQGYTNKGQILGSGLGPGTNSQLIDISWVKGFNKVGLQFERIARNNDFVYNAFIITQDFTRHWIDVSTTLHVDWQKDRFLFSGKMALIRSLNYEYFILPGLGYFKNGYDFLNFHGNLSVAYRL